MFIPLRPDPVEIMKCFSQEVPQSQIEPYAPTGKAL